jgi:hypothetical protein
LGTRFGMTIDYALIPCRVQCTFAAMNVVQIVQHHSLNA